MKKTWHQEFQARIEAACPHLDSEWYAFAGCAGIPLSTVTAGADNIRRQKMEAWEARGRQPAPRCECHSCRDDRGEA